MYELAQSRLSRGENSGANYLEVYLSGHNGPDSKSGIRQRIVGSNPTLSAK